MPVTLTLMRYFGGPLDGRPVESRLLSSDGGRVRTPLPGGYYEIGRYKGRWMAKWFEA